MASIAVSTGWLQGSLNGAILEPTFCPYVYVRFGLGIGSRMPLHPSYQHGGITLYLGNCREILPQLHPGTFDFVITNPPYPVSGRSPKPGIAIFRCAPSLRHVNANPTTPVARSASVPGS